MVAHTAGYGYGYVYGYVNGYDYGMGDGVDREDWWANMAAW
jgi:hypothetical protein